MNRRSLIRLLTAAVVSASIELGISCEEPPQVRGYLTAEQLEEFYQRLIREGNQCGKSEFVMQIHLEEIIAVPDPDVYTHQSLRRTEGINLRLWLNS